MKYYNLVILLFVSSISYSYTDCNFEIEFTYLDLSNGGPETVWVQLKQASAPLAIFKTKSSGLAVDQVNRFYSMALAAGTSGKKVRVRFSDKINCSNISGNIENFIGFFIIN